MRHINTKFKALEDFAISRGGRVKIIDTNWIIIDERVQLKCRYPPCVNYGKNRMCPPFTPSAEAFEKIIKKYLSAMVVQVDVKVPKKIQSRIKKDGARLTEMVKGKKLQKLNEKFLNDWLRFHALITDIEREAFNHGYTLSLGLVMGACMLCEECDPSQPCKHPFEARPSMEAMGINVLNTAKNAGLPFEWSEKTKISYNGLVLIG